MNKIMINEKKVRVTGNGMISLTDVYAATKEPRIKLHTPNFLRITKVKELTEKLSKLLGHPSVYPAKKKHGGPYAHLEIAIGYANHVAGADGGIGPMLEELADAPYKEEAPAQPEELLLDFDVEPEQVTKPDCQKKTRAHEIIFEAVEAADKASEEFGGLPDHVYMLLFQTKIADTMRTLSGEVTHG